MPMKATGVSRPVRCLYIGEIASGASMRSGPFFPLELPGIQARRFCPREGEALWDALQQSLFSLRREACGEPVAVAALGTGCAAALALAAQLPVDRMALVEPVLTQPRPNPNRTPIGSRGDGRQRELRRLAGFARRNLSLCACDILVVSRGDAAPALLPGRLSPHCRVTRLQLREKNGKNVYTFYEQASKRAISSFLQDGDLPKSLAENSEMCIIYE